MRAVVFAGSKRFTVDEVPTPDPGEGEARVRIEACGICGSDLHYYHGGLMARGHTPGHEMAGTIDAIGPGVNGLEVGDRVAIEPLRSCGECEYCRSGRDSICRDVELAGIHQRGGLAEQIVVASHRLYPLARDLDPAVAALTEPMAVVVHALDRGRFEKGQRVLVMGAGSIGLVTLVAARCLGAGEVFVTARHSHQAEMARQLGATRVLDEAEASTNALDRLGREVDFDLVVETVGGNANTLEAACVAARPGAHISVLGLFMASPPIAPIHLLLKELTLAWSNCYHRPTGARADFERAAELVEEQRERLALLVTHRVPLDEVNEGFALAANKRAGAIKVSVLPSS